MFLASVSLRLCLQSLMCRFIHLLFVLATHESNVYVAVYAKSVDCFTCCIFHC